MYDLNDSDVVEEILYGWETVEDEKITDQSRWFSYYEKTVKSPEGKFYNISWQAGSTEYQECDPEYEMFEVEPKEVMTTIYVRKNN